jgi:hypothetical protein
MHSLLQISVYLLLSITFCHCEPLVSNSSAPYSCLCGCCSVPLIAGICTVSASWDGWFDQNSAKCSGNPKPDCQWCTQQCQQGYPNDCDPSRVVSTCQLTPHADEDADKDFAATPENLQLMKNETAIKLTDMQMQKIARMSDDSAALLEKAGTFKLNISLNNVYESWIEYRTFLDSAGPSGLNDQSLVSMSPDHISDDSFPFLEWAACSCVCCASAGGLDCVSGIFPVVLGFSGIPSNTTHTDGVCLPICIYANYANWLPFQCPFPKSFVFGIFEFD